MTPETYLQSFSDLEILLVSEKPFHYVSGGIGPYYIDLRRGSNNPVIFNIILDKYSSKINGDTSNLLFVGVPTTGLVYATGLSLRYNQPLAVIEKLTARIHIFSAEQLSSEIEQYSTFVKESEHCAFLGLEDMGVMLATGLGIKYKRPSAILRRIQKGHGTSKTIEASLDKFARDGTRVLYIINDPYDPHTKDEITTTLHSIPDFAFEFHILNGKPLLELDISAVQSRRVIEIEDLWTTGTSAIMLYQNIKNVLGLEAEVIVFLDREQHATTKFQKLKINAKSVYKITEIAEYLVKSNVITGLVYSTVMNYVKQFERISFTDKLIQYNKSNVCVGIDITPGKFPEKAEDTTLPGYPYEYNAAGVKQYCLDLLDEIGTVPGVKVIKPNLAYYNSNDMHSILWTILQKARELDLLVILDAKIGDIMRTQSQYAEKYKEFDAVTAHGFMGADSIVPITDVQLGCYVLVFTSNPTRTDLETRPLLDESLLEEYHTLVGAGMSCEEAKAVILKKSVKVYHLMAQHVIDWQYAGSVGAVIGGTPNKEGKLQELEEIIELFATKLSYLPPILIPGVGTQGGSATDVMNAILNTLSRVGWDEIKIRTELCKVVINSSSAINYSPRPRDATIDLVTEIKIAIDKFFYDVT
uniref:Orotidine 5'-phosphate decarboxylase n=1 Tax=Marseillevirus LCMAC202 TaxID=2506606 RepID=A0A481Z042_9VIRU|nr:MAG: orotidine 5'-phosphate decarboxylase / HUMPS family [Marseillevirus LCMAC202]